MGFWDWLPWRDDNKTQSRNQAVQDVQNAARANRSAPAPSVVMNSANPNKNVTSYPKTYNPALRTASSAVASARNRTPGYDPARATRATQRYLRSAGWQGQSAGYDRTKNFGHEGETQEVGGHEYSLSPWQQKQAELDYGVKAPDSRKQLKGDTFKSGKITQAEWDTLTPQQQNALRFNELLLKAVAADKAATRPEDAGDYDSRAQNLFGTQGVSHTYAPNTLALLEGMGHKSLRGQDLDEFLSLDAAFTDEEVRALTATDQVPQLGGYTTFGNARTRETGLALDYSNIEKAGALIERALADPAARGWDLSSRVGAHLGLPGEMKIGYLPDDLPEEFDPDMQLRDHFYKDWMNQLSMREGGGTWDDLVVDFQNYGMGEQDLEGFLDYAWEVSNEMDRTGVSDPALRTGSEIRQYLGWE